MLRIGHGGASAIARANTLASFDAALEIGVDMIEFDVRAVRGRLVAAHTPARGVLRCLSLDRVLEHLASPRFAGVEFNADVKHVGCEAALLHALDAHGLTRRTLVSSQVPAVLIRTRVRDAQVRTGLSVAGRLARRSQRWRDWRREALTFLAGARCDALMAHHRLVDAALVDDLRDHGRALYAWTVNSRPGIERLRALGVDGVTTADPRLFGPYTPPPL
jgi:glycerophosphoryl diester phosphodiesterase